MQTAFDEIKAKYLAHYSRWDPYYQDLKAKIAKTKSVDQLRDLMLEFHAGSINELEDEQITIFGEIILRSN